MAGGSWWREGGSADGADGAESVYLPRQAADSPPVPAPPPVPPAPAAPPKPAAAPERAPTTDLGKPARTAGPGKPARTATSSPAEVGQAFEYSEEPGSGDFGPVHPGWTEVYYDLPAEPPAPTAEPEAEPEPASEAEAAPPGPEPEQPRPGPGKLLLRALFGKPQAAADAPAPPAAPPAATGVRKPAPLLLIGAALLLGGAVSGMLLVMLLGWGLAYLSSGWSDVTKKFAVLGIPLITVTGLTVWNWGREKGRWGSSLAPGSDAGAATWAAAPGVLRLAAVLTALFVLAVTLRRRKA